LRLRPLAIKNIPVTGYFEKAIEIIFRNVHGKKGKLVTSGMGKAGEIANNIATTFSSTGTPSVFLHPSEAQHGDLEYYRRMMFCWQSQIQVKPGRCRAYRLKTIFFPKFP